MASNLFVKTVKKKLVRNETGYNKKYYQSNRNKKLEYVNSKHVPKTTRRKGIVEPKISKLARRRQECKDLKKLCIEYKGGKCINCGYDKYKAALEFHHTNPKEKEFNIGDKCRGGKTLDSLKPELDKCILLCSNCHRAIHSGELPCSIYI
jgi:5-methylcytosine-specific restriction endonuclease McrA